LNSTTEKTADESKTAVRTILTAMLCNRRAEDAVPDCFCAITMNKNTVRKLKAARVIFDFARAADPDMFAIETFAFCFDFLRFSSFEDASGGYPAGVDAVTSERMGVVEWDGEPFERMANYAESLVRIEACTLRAKADGVKFVACHNDTGDELESDTVPWEFLLGEVPAAEP
jgi:hypothetical protein